MRNPVKLAGVAFTIMTVIRYYTPAIITDERSFNVVRMLFEFLSGKEILAAHYYGIRTCDIAIHTYFQKMLDMY